MGVSDEELRVALREVLAPPVGDVDWRELHARIMGDAERRQMESSASALGRVSAWSRGGTPFAAAVLLAASLVLWIVPAPPRPADAAPPGFWPVAEELLAGLPHESRQLLNAGTDVETMLAAVVESAMVEREAR